VLDEPTNHLDIGAVEWLEAYLKDWPGAVLIVSHDRYFLDQAATTIWEMSPALEVYRGNYSAYLVQREERYQRRLEEYQTQQEFIEKEEEYIRRNIAGQNTRQAQGRRRRLERMLEEARLTPPKQARTLRFV
jgi:ATP-binding cassette subfamily F protein 3